ncbi:hypothetical protein [Sphingomonas yunnanensis]|nr:hypothetical protein [Sphingomonas yunnanensis]
MAMVAGGSLCHSCGYVRLAEPIAAEARDPAVPLVRSETTRASAT